MPARLGVSIEAEGRRIDGDDEDTVAADVDGVDRTGAGRGAGLVGEGDALVFVRCCFGRTADSAVPSFFNFRFAA